MSSSVIPEFLAASTDQRMRIIRQGDHDAELAAYFGAQAWSEYQTLSASWSGDGRHLAWDTPPNVVFVPGVMGSVLQGRHKPGVWWFDVRTRRHLNDLALSPDGSTSADPANELDPATADPSYEPFAVALLAQEDLGYRTFAYDWRKPLERSTDQLRRLIEDCHRENGGKPVHLVAHSMGGLMVRATLMAHGDVLWPKLGRIVFIATPHYGSGAIAGYLKNHFWGWELLTLLGRYLSRATFRSLWGPLGMLPAPVGIYPGTRPNAANPWRGGDPDDDYRHPCANFDPYHAESWKLELTTAETAQLQKVLDSAADFHRRMHAFHAGLMQDQRDRMLIIAGVGYKTLFRLAYERRFFGLWEHAKKTTSRIPGDPHRDGDGRVPLASATLDDVEIRYARGVHGEMTNIPAVWQDTFDFLRGKPLKLPTTPQGALSGHLDVEDRSPAPHLDGSAGTKATVEVDDPGYWKPEEPASSVIDALDQDVDQGKVPEFALIKIF
jgi:pimeloyl-ACP methyl ester carboxylesterase